MQKIEILADIWIAAGIIQSSIKTTIEEFAIIYVDFEAMSMFLGAFSYGSHRGGWIMMLRYPMEISILRRRSNISVLIHLNLN